jgi:hypothetical protein
MEPAQPHLQCLASDRICIAAQGEVPHRKGNFAGRAMRWPKGIGQRHRWAASAVMD